jgi:asparagine synthase (glutamine-hydrolysing)
MCGITGFIDIQRRTATEAGNSIAHRMADQIVHRGPDDFGVWSDPEVGVFLAHRRLSIVDLSPAGHQPMVSFSGRHVMAFNGEVYNHAELRQDLETHRCAPAWRGRSDTEVILAAIEQWGLRTALNRFVGMFAIALWDRRDRELVLVRDRVGEKPLYWGHAGTAVLFGSELKALRAHPAFKAEVDRDALALFLRYSYIPAPYSIYRGVRKIEAGTLVRIRLGDADPIKETYWSARDVATFGQREPWRGNDADGVAELERLINQSVALQLVADVPVGAFLSGGIDSSVVVALAQTQSSHPINTFSIGFDEKEYNEAHHAKAIAHHLGTNHTELYVSGKEAMSVISKLPNLYDEPFADSSQIPTFLVAELARKQVVVSLSGDGGDELFAGYTRYLMGNRLSLLETRLPQFVRRTLAAGMLAISPQGWNQILAPLLLLIPKNIRYANLGDKLHRLAGVVHENSGDIYRNLVSHWTSPARVVINANEPETLLTRANVQPDFKSFVERGAWLDFVSYLPDDVLAKLDRAAMAVSLESRVPLLDHRVIEFAWHLPLSMKLRNGTGKWLLREVLYRHVPRKLLERPKTGFGIPLDSWLRGPLREWAEALLDETRLKREGFFYPEPIRHKWQEHLSGKRSWHHCLWNVLMFQAWLESQKSI